METGELYTGLNSAQREAVAHDGGPALVVAGAGTGKTSVITRRIARLIAEGKAQPHEILALTFTEKAAHEMEERVDVLLPLGVVDVAIMTFNSFGDSLLKTYGMDIGLPAGIRVANRAQQIFFLREHFDELELEYFAPWANPSSQLGAMLDFFSKLRDELIDPLKFQVYADKLAAGAGDEADRLEASKQQELARVYRVYTDLKRQIGMIDYDDQINLSIELLQQRANVLRELQTQYKYILVDEFQDTNYAQNYLLRQLAGESGNIMAVGDDDQSIYKFRGASVSNIMAFSEDYAEVKQIVLTENYRSTQQILDASYRLIQHNNPDRLEAKYGIAKELHGQTSGAEPELLRAPDHFAEAQSVAADIARALQDGTKPQDIAILIRKRKQAEEIIPALRRLEIPYRYLDMQQLHKQPEIEVLLYFLQYIADPTQSNSLYHLLESDIFGIDIHFLTLASGIGRRTNRSLDAMLREYEYDDEPLRDKIAAALELLDALRDLAAKHTARELLYQFLKRSGYLVRLEERAETDPSIVLTFENYHRFLEALASYQEVAADKSVHGFIRSYRDPDDLAGMMAYKEPDSSGNEVQVLTIHQAKGLEFDSVYIYDVNQDAIPGRRKPEGLKIADELLAHELLPTGDWHIQEERRLMYVAITRAKRRLVMSFSQYHGGKRPRKPSIFLPEALGYDITINPSETPVPVLERIGRLEPLMPVAQLIDSKLFRDGKLHLTPHQIDDYLTCPYNFRYRHILGVPQEPSPNAMYGTLIHSVINDYYIRKQAGQTAALPELLSMIPRLWASEGFESEREEAKRRAQAESTIRRFFAREEAADQAPTLIEKSFNLDLPEHDVNVRGRIDAIYETPGGVEIRDYKTSQTDDSSKAEKKAKTSEQLAIYALAWQRMSGAAPDRVVLDFVDTGQLGVATKSEKDLEKTLAKIGEVAAGIRAGQFPRGNCMFCEHRPLAIDTAPQEPANV